MLQQSKAGAEVESARHRQSSEPFIKAIMCLHIHLARNVKELLPCLFKGRNFVSISFAEWGEDGEECKQKEREKKKARHTHTHTHTHLTHALTHTHTHTLPNLTLLNDKPASMSRST